MGTWKHKHPMFSLPPQLCSGARVIAWGLWKKSLPSSWPLLPFSLLQLHLAPQHPPGMGGEPGLTLEQKVMSVQRAPLCPEVRCVFQGGLFHCLLLRSQQPCPQDLAQLPPHTQALKRLSGPHSSLFKPALAPWPET